MRKLIIKEFDLTPRQFDAIVELVIEFIIEISNDIEKRKAVEFELIDEGNEYIN